MDVLLPTLVTGAFAGLSLGLSHWLLPARMHPVAAYAYGSFFCLAALTALGVYLEIRWEFLLAAWGIWFIAGLFVAGQYAKEYYDESRKNADRLNEK